MKLGIIGFGGMGCHHSEILKDCAEVRVTRVYDVDPQRLEEARRRGFAVAQSEAELLDSDEVDTVLIATPNDSHAEIAQRAMKKGKHVLLEKPATVTSEEFSQLVEVSHACGVVLNVHQNRRYDADFLAIRELVQSSGIGEVYRIESNVVGANGIPGAWRKVRAQGGGMVLDWGVHLIDQMVSLYGRQVESVYCRCSSVYGEEVDDGFYAELTFRGGAVCCLTVDTNAFVAKPRWQVFGYNGSAEISGWEQPLKAVRPACAEGAQQGIRAGNGFTKTMAPRPDSTVREESRELPSVPCDVFYRDMVSALDRGEPLVPEADVQYVLRIMERMFESDRLHQTVKMD